MASLAQEVRDRLLRELRGGAFPDGRLPPEAKLARALGVSRATVRAALQTLAEDGIVSRRRRHGTVVNEHVLRGSLPLNRLLSFRELVEQTGAVASVDPLVRRVEPPAEDVATALGVAPDEPCLTVERLVRADGVPVVTVTDVLPVARLVVDLEDVVDDETTFAFIARNTAATVDHSLVEVVPAVAGGGEPRHLELPDGMPYVALHELLFSPDQEPVAFSRIAVDGRHVRLSLSRREV